MSTQRTTVRKALIPQFYAGKSIFITGATGFMGKVLLERLLSTCPDIGRLYLLLRSKKDVPPEKRLLQLKQSPVFDVLRKTNPAQLDKLCILAGDVALPRLGMTHEALALLNNVSIVFHVAATLKFDEELRIAVDQNVRSVISVMDICDKLPKIEAFIHVSTAYSNADREVVAERIYPSPVPVDEVISLVDSIAPTLLSEITLKYIAPKPNTYTFTKAIAECAVEQHGNRNYSIAIFRPSIVVSSLKDPFPGWIENLNGPSGVVVGAGKGFLHVFCHKTSAIADMLPVDIAIDTLIAAAWETAIDKSSEIKVYNCCTYENPTTWGQFEKYLRKEIINCPMDQVIWYPSGAVVESRFLEKILQITLQTIPLHLAEYARRMLGMKSKISLITADQRLRAMSNVLKFFSLREWKFETTNVQKLKARLSPEDAQIYNLDVHSIDWAEHVANFVRGTRRYLLKEKDQDVEKAKRHMRRMLILHRAALFFTLAMFVRLLLSNQMIRDLVYGTLRLLMSLFSMGYERMVKREA